MTQAQQPEALLLAECLTNIAATHTLFKESAAELRRLHAVEAELAALKAAPAQVVMPEPSAYIGTWRPAGLIVDHHICGFTIEGLKNSSPASTFEPLYTEQQVRALLAGDAPAFGHVAQQKLTSLQARGYQITGYAIEKTDVGGTDRGFINAGGFVGWWRGDDEWNATVAREVERRAKAAGAAPYSEAAALHEALRNVYECARAVLRYDGVDQQRAIHERDGLIQAIEAVKTIDAGYWEPKAAGAAPAVPSTDSKE